MFNEHHARAGSGRLNRAGANSVGTSTAPTSPRRYGGGCADLLGVAGSGMAEYEPSSHVRSDAPKPPPVARRPAGWVVGGTDPTVTKNLQVTTSPCGRLGGCCPAAAERAGPAEEPAGTDLRQGRLRGGHRAPDPAARHWRAARRPRRRGNSSALLWPAAGRRRSSLEAPRSWRPEALGLTQLGRSSSAYAWTVGRSGAAQGPTSTSPSSGRAYYGYLSYLDPGPRRSPP